MRLAGRQTGCKSAGPARCGGFGALRTGPYPAFPTDAQPLLGAVAAGAWGQSRITETIFDRRFRYLEGLTAMGAAVQTEGDTACFFRPYPPRGAGGGHRPAGGRSPHPGGLGRPGRAGSTACPISTGATRGWKGSLRPWAGGFVGKPGKRLDVEHGRGNRYGETRDPNQIP